MADFLLNLKGEKYRKSGSHTRGDTVNSQEFPLKQGIVLMHVRHEGTGKFHLELVPTEGWSKTEANIASTGAALGTGAATGAAIGSIVPGLGTLVGMGIGAAAGYFVGGKAGEKVAEAIYPQVYEVDHTGQLDDYVVIGVKSQDQTSLWPGKHRLEVQATGKWSVQLIQPELDQAEELLASDEDEEQFRQFLGPGHWVIPPMKTGNKPLIAIVQHKGRSDFMARAISVDGIHDTTIFEGEGQFFQEDIRTDLIPQKEYILEIFADGEWILDFQEGY